MIHISKNQSFLNRVRQLRDQPESNRPLNHSVQVATFIRRSLNQISLLLLLAWVATGITACSSAKDEVAPANTGESVSYKVDGKAYSGNDVTFIGDESYFSLYSTIAISSSINSPGYLLKLEVDKPKVGTFTAQSGGLTGGITYLTSLTNFQAYDITTKAGGTISFTSYNMNGFAEGTFSFVGKTDKGATVNITEGKFRISLK